MSTNGHVDLTALAKEFTAQRATLVAQLAEVEKKLEAVRILSPAGNNPAGTELLSVNLTGLSQTAALLKLAQASPNGHLLAQSAKKALLAHKLVPDNKNATSATFAALKRTKGLHKVGRGEYALNAEAT
jgi:hypothetical protein